LSSDQLAGFLLRANDPRVVGFFSKMYETAKKAAGQVFLAKNARFLGYCFKISD